MGRSGRTTFGFLCHTLLVSVSALAIATTAEAQQAQPNASPARPTATAKQAVAPKAAPKAETPAPLAAPSASETTLKSRVENLEEQLVEMQVTIGTLDSLAKGNGSSSSGVYRGSGSENGAPGADAGRVAALETQVRALATQVDQLNQQIRQLSASRAATPVASAAVPSAQTAPAAAVPAAPAASPPASNAQVASAIDSSDPIGRLVGGTGQRAPAASAPVIAPATQDASASMPQAGASDASAKQAYETAYGHLLQQDFGAAELAFDDFLKRFPADPLAGNAQYWLGETFFARGQFKPAAAAFLKGYQSYGRSAKAPDSVLKLAMSLDKLGQKDAACASYSELNTKFPNAPAHVKTRADTERRRLGCA